MTQKETREAAYAACQAAVDKKGEEVVLLDLEHLPAPADFYVILTCHTHVHAKAIAQNIENVLESFSLKRRGIEGYPGSSWILLDYYQVVVHILAPEERDYYNLQRVWPDAKIIKFDEK